MPEHHVSSPTPPRLAQRLLGNSLWNFLAFLVLTLLTIVSAPVYIHYLGLQQYGLLVLLMSIVVPLDLVNLGFGKATIKFVAESLARGDMREAGTYVQTTLLFNLGIGVVGAAVIGVLARPLSQNVFEIAPADRAMAEAAMWWIAMDWIATQMELTLANIPVAKQNYRLASIGNTISASINIVLGLAVLVLGGNLLNLVQARLIWGGVTVAAWVVVDRRLLPEISLWPRFHRLAFRRSFRFSVWQSLAGVGGMLGGQTDKYLLGIYRSTTAVGLYNIPSLIFGTAYSAVETLGQVLFPAISDLQGRGRTEDLYRVVLNATWLLASLMVALMGTVFVFAADILRLYIGAAYTPESAQVLQLFAFAAMLSAPAIGMTQYLLGIGKTNWLALITLASGTLVLVGGLILIPSFGLQGAAWSNLFAIALTRPLIYGVIWKRFWRPEVSFFRFQSYLYGPSVTGWLVAPLVLFGRNALVQPLNWAGLLAGGLAVFGLLLVSILALDLVLPWGRERRQNLLSLGRQFSALSPQRISNHSKAGL